MKKIIAFCSSAVIAAGLFAVTIGGYSPSISSAVGSDTGDADAQPVFFASMHRSDSWGQQGSVYNPEYGMYRIPIDATEPYSRVFETAASMVTDGGFYYDGKYYWVTSRSVGSAWMDKYESVYHVSDAETFAELSSVTSTKQYVFGSDFTYDYVGGFGYAVGATSYSSVDNPMTSSELKRIDVATGEFTVIGSNNARIKALACDGNGQLWGIGLPLDLSTPTNLYRIDKTTGEVAVAAVIDKNLYNPTKTSATFDLRNGKLYWSATTYRDDENSQRVFESAIYEVNLTTGATKQARLLENSEVLAGMILKDCHPKAPQTVKNLDFQFTAGSTTSGKVRFTLPTVSFDHTPLTAPLSATIIINGEEHSVGNLTPGQTYEDVETSLSSGGSHVVKVFCYKDELKSLPSVIEPYAGTDAPAAVTNVTIDASVRGERATVSWTAPTSGASGGYIDTDKLTYTVIRKPDNKTVAEGITDTQFTDELDRVMALTQYDVKAVIDGVESESAYSDAMLLGTAYSIPYMETFDTNSNFLTYTVIDNNQDANDTDGGTWYYNPNGFNVMYYTNLRQADDYLITPTLDLSSDKIYRFQFHSNGYMTGDCHFIISAGTAATVEAQTHKIAEEQFTTSRSTSTFYTLFRPADGECRLSIHNVSDGTDHMYVDNIVVSEYGSIDIPDVSTSLSAERSGKGVLLKFTAPATSVRGDRLTTLDNIKIYRAGELSPAATLTDGVAPAAELTWLDESPATGINQYIITAANSNGDGLEAYIVFNTNNDIPRAVTNINVAKISGYAEAEITWEQDLIGVNGGVLTQSDITYDIYRNIGVYSTLIAENVEGLSYTDRGLTEAFGERRQEYVNYTIVPQTNGGKGESAVSATELIGKSYDLPYKETWTGQASDTYPWTTGSKNNGSWYIASTGYDPYTQGQDGTGLATFSINRSASYGQADYISPKIDVSSFKNVQIQFYLFHSNSANCRNSALQIGIDTEEKGTVMLPEKISVYASESGWQEHTLQLPDEYAGCDRLSLVFRGESSSYKGSVHIDNVRVSGYQPAYEVKVDGITGPERCIIGKDNIYVVEVKNIGTENNSNIAVRLLADGMEVGEETIGNIEAGTSQRIGFYYMPGIDNQERVITLSAEIEAGNDEYAANNSSEISVSLIAPMLPRVADLTGDSHDSKAYLSWSDNTVYPHQEYVTDDVESYPEFAIDNLEGWTFVDADKAAVTKFSLDGSTVVQWENTGVPQAFIVFNTVSAGTSDVIIPRSGSQCFISWESTASSGNDDWMVSPLLSTEAQTISFYAKALYPLLPDEQFEVWVSQSTDDLSDFTKISGSTPVTVASATEWTKYSYQLPEGARYFAIRCVSKHQFGLMVDDISYSPAHSPIEFWGYNVYRDGRLLTTDAIGDTEYVDSDVVVGGTYRYNVTALYDSGEAIYSNDVNLTISDVTGVGSISGGEDVIIRAVPGGISVAGANGEIINVYSISGACICSVRGTADDRLPLQTGIYIVSVGDITVKVAVK